jgi:hypothetical protein
VRLFSYVVEHDFGFAPNPFHGFLTLATCKADIRSAARVGDYVVGTGSVVHRRTGYLVYFMRVGEVVTYEEYWTDDRFSVKKPRFNVARKVAYGDNIYHKVNGVWVQGDSFHSMPGGGPNEDNLRRDTRRDKVLIAHHFAYWGGSGPEIPPEFRQNPDQNVLAGRGHRSNFLPVFAADFVAWLESLGVEGYVGVPTDWDSERRKRKRSRKVSANATA